MITRVLTDNVDDAGARLLRVMQIGQTIAQPRPQMQQRCRRLAGHAVVTIGRSGHHALEQPENATHTLHAIQRGYKMHLRCAGIGETHIHIAVE